MIFNFFLSSVYRVTEVNAFMAFRPKKSLPCKELYLCKNSCRTGDLKILPVFFHKQASPKTNQVISREMCAYS